MIEKKLVISPGLSWIATYSALSLYSGKQNEHIVTGKTVSEVIEKLYRIKEQKDEKKSDS